MADPKTFVENVEGIGTFTFRRRSMLDELNIAAEFSRFLDGVATPTPYFENLAGMLAVLKVLTVDAPDEWDPISLDPLDPDSYQRLLSVHGALRAREDTFRPKPAKKGA